MFGEGLGQGRGCFGVGVVVMGGGGWVGLLEGVGCCWVATLLLYSLPITLYVIPILSIHIYKIGDPK